MEATSKLTSKGQVTIPKSVRDGPGPERRRRAGLPGRGQPGDDLQAGGLHRAGRLGARAAGTQRCTLGRDRSQDPPGALREASLTAFLDTNVVIRHLTGDPPGQAARATAALASDEPLLLSDVVFAACVFVLESGYGVTRERVADLLRSIHMQQATETVNALTLLRALAIYELDGLDFAEAHLAAQAEATGVREILSFDRSIDRLATVTRREH
ncbi:MAG: PIN domain-containing protein [Solirubrobacterales bacterium]